MSNPARTSIIVIVCSLVVVACVAGLYRRGTAAIASAERENSEVKAQLDSIAGELAAIKDQLSQLNNRSAATREIFLPSTSTGQSNALNQVAEMIVQMSNTLALVQSLNTTPQANISPEKELIGRQQVFAVLSNHVTAQEQKVAETKSKLMDWAASLKIPDEVATQDPSTALKTPSLANYWPYFEAKLELDEASDYARLMKRKAQIEQLEIAVETARHSGIAR